MTELLEEPKLAKTIALFPQALRRKEYGQYVEVFDILC